MWYYASNEERKGPVTEQAIQSLYAMKQVSPNTLVWQDGMTDWKPLSETELAAVLEIPLPEGDAWQTCAYSGERGKQSLMVPLDGYLVLTEHKDSAVDFIKQGGELPKADLGDRMAGNVGLGHLMQQSWGLVLAQGRQLALLYLALWLPCNLLSNWMDMNVFGDDEPMRSFQLYNFIYLVVGNLFVGAAYSTFWRRLAGHDSSLGDMVAAGFANWGRMIAVSLLSGLMMIAGFILLIVPGIIVMARTYPALALAVERKMRGSSAVQASWDLTKGHTLQVVGYSLLVWFLASVPLMVFESLIAFAPQFEEWISYSVLQTLLGLGEIFVVAFTVCYVRELRALKRMRVG